MGYGYGFNDDQGITGRAPKGQRYIHTESMVAHIWAQQGEQTAARTSRGTIYFKDESIYSYGSHFEIARFLPETYQGKRIVAFTKEEHSNPTSGHKRAVRSALDGLDSVIMIDVDKVTGVDNFATETNTARLVRAYVNARTMLQTEAAELAEAEKKDSECSGNGFRGWFVHNHEQSMARYRNDVLACKAYYSIILKKRMPRDPAAWLERYDSKVKRAAQKAKDDAHKKKVSEALASAKRAKSLDVAATEAESRAHNVPLLSIEHRFSVTADKAGKAAHLLSRTGNPKHKKPAKVLRDTAALLRKHADAIMAEIQTKQRKDLQRTARWQLAQTLRAFRKNPNGEYRTDRAREALGREWIIDHPERGADAGPCTMRAAARIISFMELRNDIRDTFEALHPDAWNVRYERDMARRDKKPVATLESWLNGANVTPRVATGLTYVRRKGDLLQTSRGAECPWSHAVIAYRMAERCHLTGTSWQRNGKTIRVGVFQVDRIDSDGNLYAGCHTIRFAEMRDLALRELGRDCHFFAPVPIAA